MNDKVKALLEKAKSEVKKVNKKTATIAGVAAALVVLLIVIIVAVNNGNDQGYSILFTGLNNSELSTIVSYLEDQGVSDYKVQTGDTILVRSNQETSLKAKLVMQGYPKSGFSYDHNTYFGNVGSLSTESERTTAKLYDLEEKMADVIRCFDGVRDATVNVTPGENRSYVLDSGNVVEATAAVALEMNPGETLSTEMADAIRHYVSRSVQGLDIESVSITDTYGNTYSGTGGFDTSESTYLKFALQEKVNNQIRTEVMHLLEGFYGRDNVKVGVNTTVDIDTVTSEETTYRLPEYAEDGNTNGEGIIGSKIWDDIVIRNPEEAVGGVVGTTTNADLSEYIERELNPDGSEEKIESSGQVDYRTDTRKDYIYRTSGTVTDCHIAVSINSATGNSVNENALTNHVAQVAGINAEDAAAKVSILSLPFYDGTQDGPGSQPDDLEIGGRTIPTWAVYAAIIGAAIFFLLVLLFVTVINRRRRRKRELQAQMSADAAQQKALEELLATVGVNNAAYVAPPDTGADVMDMQSEKIVDLRRDIREFAEANPSIAAQMVKTWLRGSEDG